MNKYRVYSKDGRVERCETASLEYHGEWLGACSVTLSVSSAAPIDFEIGDYVEYRGERFTINYDPTELKQASKDSYGEAFKYENIVFNSYSDELTRCMFLDYVKNDNMIHYSSLPVFSFYAEDITYLAERIQVNLDRIYTGEEKWVVEVHPEYVNVTNRNISVSSVHVWDALALVKSEFDANFIIRGRKIIIGTEGIAVDKLFSYGKGNGLYSIQKTAESDQAIVTRLRAYGSVKNMPMSYYKDVTTKCFFPEHEVSSISDSRLTLATTVDITKCFTARWEGEANNVYRVKVQIGSVTAVAKAYVYDNPKVTLDVNTDTGNTSAAVKAIVDAYRANSERVELVSGVDKSKYPLAYVESSPMPNNMAISNLMLPSFPNESLDPYIDSENIAELGVREGTIFFDGSGDLEEIYPTLEGMTAEELKAAGVPTASSGALDEVVMAEQVADDGTPNGSNEARQATFTITIKDIGFDLNDYASDNAVIAMTTGMCGGREFTIEKCERVDGGYQLTCSRVKDETIGLYFPYNYYNIAAGDKFVLLNIDMPDVYVKAASERLLAAAKAWLSKNDYTRYVYEPKVDEIFMARQHAEAMASGGVSIHDTIKEGDLMLFEDADLGVNGSIIINSLTIKEDGSDVPTYEVVLREDKAVGTIQKIQNQIDSIVKHGVSGGGYNSQQIQQLIKSFGDKYFINKTKDDRSVGTIASDKGFEVGEYTEGVLGSGAAMYMDEHGSSHIVGDYLDVRKKATFTTISVQELKHVGGEVILSPAAMVCSRVEEVEEGYKCYFNTEDSDGRRIYNEFEVGDQARCQTFNLENNTYYWRLVTEIGNDYIVLSKTDCDAQSDVPSVGDNISLLGNRNDVTRQAAIVLSAYGEDAPSYKQYSGIDSYSLVGKQVTKLSPNGNELTGVLNIEVGSTGAANLADFPDEVFKSVHIGAVNLLLNSGFTGDYESEELSSNYKLQIDSELYSKALKHWNGIATISDDAEAVSGRCVELGSLSQSVKLIKGESYVISFKAKGGNIAITCGDYSVNQSLSADYQRYQFKFVSNGSGSFLISGEAKVCDLQLERGTISTDWNPSPYDNDKAMATFQALKYMQDAIKEGDTTILGGLILSSMIQLGNYKNGKMEKVNAGMSGIYSDDDDVAFWGGGTYEQAIRTITKFKQNPHYMPTEDEWNGLANFVVSHGGDAFYRGYIYALGGYFRGKVDIANGKILLNDDGSGKLANGAFEWDANGVVRKHSPEFIERIRLIDYIDHKIKLDKGTYFDATVYYEENEYELPNAKFNDTIVSMYCPIGTRSNAPAILTGAFNVNVEADDGTYYNLDCNKIELSYSEDEFTFRWTGEYWKVGGFAKVINDVVYIYNKEIDNGITQNIMLSDGKTMVFKNGILTKYI